MGVLAFEHGVEVAALAMLLVLWYERGWLISEGNDNMNEYTHLLMMMDA